MRKYAVKEIDLEDGYRVADQYGDFVHGLTSEQAEKLAVMINRAFQKGFDQCGSQVRKLIGA